MKGVILMIMGIIGFSFSSEAQQQNAGSNAMSGKRILVAYFSCTGTTEQVANTIAETVDGTLYRITPAKAYSSEDLNWNEKDSRSSVEMADEKSRPELGGDTLAVEDYDIIFLGYPIWWNLCPRAVNTFLEKYDFTGKSVIPFATSGGSSIANSVKQLKNLYPKIEWSEGKLLNGGARQAGEWAKQTVE